MLVSPLKKLLAGMLILAILKASADSAVPLYFALVLDKVKLVKLKPGLSTENPLIFTLGVNCALVIIATGWASTSTFKIVYVKSSVP